MGFTCSLLCSCSLEVSSLFSSIIVILDYGFTPAFESNDLSDSLYTTLFLGLFSIDYDKSLLYYSFVT